MKRILPRLANLGLAFFLSLFLLPKSVLAQTYYFNEEFNEERANVLNPDKWIVYPNQRCGNWPNIREHGGFVKLSQQCLSTTQFPYIVSKVNPFPPGNWSAEIAFKYTHVTYWGDGIVLAEAAPANGTTTSASAVLVIYTWQDNTYSNMRVNFDGRDIYAIPVNTSAHTLKVDRLGKKYLIYLDGSLIFTSPDTDKEVKVIWLGNPTLQPPIPLWTEFMVDYIRVSRAPPALPVIFIPGIGGSEFKTSQDIIWSQPDGHGGTYSHAYPGGEKVWVNETEATMPGDDDYFDVLRLKDDGQTPEADLALTENLTPFGYPEIDSFFQDLGYQKGTNFFVFTYDWRKDISLTKAGLDSLIELAKQKSGKSKVNVVAHSMGGLVARYYIADPAKAVNVDKLISLGVPHLGSVDSLKSLLYGNPFKKKLFSILSLGIPASEVKDVSRNLASVFELNPSTKYYDFYNNYTSDHPYPFRDDRDIDQNQEIGPLNFNQLKTLLTNLSHNMTVFGMSEQFHNFLDPIINQNNAVKLYHIAGSSQPTLGQIREGWWINWPIRLIPRYEEVYINGDDTVPLYSATLKSPSLDLSGEAKIYYVEQKHSDLVTSNGIAMQTVRAILNEYEAIPVEVKSEKIVLEGEQISVDQDAQVDLFDDAGKHTGLKDNGDIETNIPGTFYDTLGNSTQVFIKKNASPVKIKIKPSPNAPLNVRLRRYQEDKITKTTAYHKIPVTQSSSVELAVNPATPTSPLLTVDAQTIPSTNEATGSAALDQTPPATNIQLSGTTDQTKNYTTPVTITFNSTDQGSGVLQTEYSLDNGQTVQSYTAPIIVTAPGMYTLQVTSTDKLGNQEKPQTLSFTLSPLPTPTPTPTPLTTASSAAGSGPDSNNNSDSGTQTSSVPTAFTNLIQPIIKLAKKILPNTPAEAIEGKVLGAKTTPQPKPSLPIRQKLSGLLFIAGSLITVLSLTLVLTFIKIPLGKKTPR